jgi:hypothetical protein
VALMHGPILLGAKTGTTELTGLIANADRYGHVPGGTLMAVNTAPTLAIDRGTFASRLLPVAGKTLTYKAPDLMANKADTALVLEPFFRIHDARYMMYWKATVTGTVGVEVQQHIPASTEISLFKGAIKFSFTTADPSRHVIFYSLAGQRIADIPAFSQTVTMNYSHQGIRMKNGMYAIRIMSSGNAVSKTLLVNQ